MAAFQIKLTQQDLQVLPPDLMLFFLLSAVRRLLHRPAMFGQGPRCLTSCTAADAARRASRLTTRAQARTRADPAPVRVHTISPGIPDRADDRLSAVVSQLV